MARNDGRGVEAIHRRERLQQPARIPIDHHRHPILDEKIASEEDALPGKPDHEIPGRVSCAWMADDDGAATRNKGVRAGDWNIRRVGELESPHRIQAYDPDPVRHESVFSSLGREHSPIRVGNDLGAQSAKDNGAEMMVGVMMSEDEPLDRRGGKRPDRLEESFTLTRTG